jgi:hypothetical protein
MALLYHISMDDTCKSMFTYTAAVPIILDFLLQVQGLGFRVQGMGFRV